MIINVYQYYGHHFEFIFVFINYHKSQVRVMKILSLKIENVKKCCLVRDNTHVRSDNRWIWRNCRMVFISSGKPKEVRSSTTASTMILTWSHPGLNPRLHYIIPLFKLPELLYSVLFHIYVSYSKFYVCCFQMQILWQQQDTCWFYAYDPHV
jgi:hypothetical protein